MKRRCYREADVLREGRGEEENEDEEEEKKRQASGKEMEEEVKRVPVNSSSDVTSFGLFVNRLLFLSFSRRLSICSHRDSFHIHFLFEIPLYLSFSPHQRLGGTMTVLCSGHRVKERRDREEEQSEPFILPSYVPLPFSDSEQKKSSQSLTRMSGCHCQWHLYLLGASLSPSLIGLLLSSVIVSVVSCQGYCSKDDRGGIHSPKTLR